MNKILRDRVMGIAVECRYIIEGHMAPSSDSMSGWCAVASAQLFRMLEANGISSEIHMWNDNISSGSHVFLVVDDHVVDVTVNQFREFRNKDILILHQCEAEGYYFFQTSKVFSSPESLIVEQRKNNWPKSQIAKTTLIKERR